MYGPSSLRSFKRNISSYELYDLLDTRNGRSNITVCRSAEIQMQYYGSTAEESQTTGKDHSWNAGFIPAIHISQMA